MKLEFYVNGEVSVIDLDKLAAEHAGIINIGRKCKQVWNAVKIDDESVEPFPWPGTYGMSERIA